RQDHQVGLASQPRREGLGEERVIVHDQDADRLHPPTMTAAAARRILQMLYSVGAPWTPAFRTLRMPGRAAAGFSLVGDAQRIRARTLRGPAGFTGVRSRSPAVRAVDPPRSPADPVRDRFRGRTGRQG